MSEMRHALFVEMLDFDVALGVMCSRDQLLDPIRTLTAPKEPGHELPSIVSHQIGWNPVRDDSIIYKNGRCVRPGYLGERYGHILFCTSFC